MYMHVYYLDDHVTVIDLCQQKTHPLQTCSNTRDMSMMLGKKTLG